MLFISLSANNKNIKTITKKAEELKLKVKDEMSWDSGFKYDDKSRRNVKVMQHSEELYNFILSLEPTVELNKKQKLLPGHLSVPSPEEIIKLGY